jgi:curved DNA-binding protein CbpA
MSEETYYTVLNVKETASSSEIKTAYRELIKQIHPDTIANSAPYLRRIAEEKAQEITEAYSVLSNSSKRRNYDRQLAAYRGQNATQAPPVTAPPPPQQAASQTSSGRWLGYNSARLMRWSREHPVLALFIVIGAIAFVSTFLSDEKFSKYSMSRASTASSSTSNAKAASMGPYSQYPCDLRDKVSPIDGKPCERQDQSVPAPPPEFVVDEKSFETHPSTPPAAVSGAYVGTVHNVTANLSSMFTVVIHQTKTGLLDGCVEVKSPLQGSGALRGRIRGSHLNFVVADIAFQGDALKNEITGSYVVTRQEGNQLGDFHLTKRPGPQGSYGCSDDGALIEFERAETPKTKPVVKTPAGTFATVTGRYGAAIYKRCAFLPSENFGRCNYGPEEVAELKQGDRVRILSPMTRAQSGDDIYKVRTPQGWEGWARAEDLTLEP